MKTKTLGLLLLLGPVAWQSSSAVAAVRLAESPRVEKEETVILKDGDPGMREHTRVIIKGIEPSEPELDPGKETPWLGLSTGETSEALAAQLGLDPGAGLTVDFVAPESPAAKAGLQKNDVLVKFENQLLVHPAQLRKLVQTRKEGDEVRIVFYRGGKEQSAKVTVGKTKRAPMWGLLEGDPGFNLKMHELQRQLNDLPLKEGFRDRMKELHESLGHLKIDQDKVRQELRHSLEAAQRSLEHALLQATNLSSVLDPAKRALRELEESKILVDRDSKVTVRSDSNSVKSIVQSDDQGTLVIVADPKPRLTAHDKKGKLLFDGPIETDEQQRGVPAEVWKRAEPMLKKLEPEAEN